MGLTTKDYLAQLQALLPQGYAWPRDEDACLTRLLSAQADGLARVDARADQLLTKEADPREAGELLTDWERVTGLPDMFLVEDDSIQQTTAQRRAAVVTRLTALGGQSCAYFIGLAESLGYTITITEFRPFRAGMSSAGDALTNGDWVFTWQVNAPLNTIVRFRAGASAAGEALGVWGNQFLERVLNRYKPAHTQIIFAYKGGD